MQMLILSGFWDIEERDRSILRYQESLGSAWCHSQHRGQVPLTILPGIASLIGRCFWEGMNRRKRRTGLLVLPESEECQRDLTQSQMAYQDSIALN